MNALSFRLSLWYSSGVFALIVVILTLMYIIVFDGVFLFIITLFSSGTTLLIPCGSGGGGCDDLLIALNIKPDVYSLGGCGPSVYGLFIWFIAINLLSQCV